MKVKELVQILNGYNQELEVEAFYFAQDEFGEDHNVYSPIDEVRLEDGKVILYAW